MVELNKIEVINDPSINNNDETSKTFVLNDEDHTLANALRYLIMKNPNVIFCGYTQPHPSENKVNFKIQTTKQTTALDVLEKGLNDLNQVCQHVLETFKREIEQFEQAEMEH